MNPASESESARAGDGDGDPPPPPPFPPPPPPPPPPFPPPASPKHPLHQPALEDRAPPELTARSSQDAPDQSARRRFDIVPPAPTRFDLQNRILHDHYDMVLPNLLAPSAAPAPVWVTPPSLLPRFNMFFIENALRHLLAPGPSRLRVERVDDAVFMVTVSSRNVANVLAVTGSLLIADVRLFFHPSLMVAKLAASRLPPLVQTVQRPVQTGASAVIAPSTGPTTIVTALSSPKAI